jgi:hypothetical protein
MNQNQGTLTINEGEGSANSTASSSPPPSGVCQVHLTLTTRGYCGRKLFGTTDRCYWHAENKDKYGLEAVESYFGVGVTLAMAIEAEIAGGRSLELAYLANSPLGGSLVTAGCNLSKGKFVRAYLRDAHLSYSDLQQADFAFANLENAYLSDCNISGARFTGARLFNAKFRSNSFSNVIGLTKESFRGLRSGWLPIYQMLEEYPQQSEGVYRLLATHFSSQGMLEDASWAAYRACLMRHRLFRERLSSVKIWADEYVHSMFADPDRLPELMQSLPGIAPRRISFRLVAARGIALMQWAKSLALLIVAGYGEKPLRVLLNAGLTIVLYGLVYQWFGAIDDKSFVSCLYFSAITFTTVGYGDLAPHGALRLVAASEALAGILLCGLFLFCLGRRSVGRA